MAQLEITTMVGCPLMCTFCPQEELKRAYSNPAKYMLFDNFKRYLNKIPKHVRIDFSGMAEPWANKSTTEMLIHTLEKGYKVAIYTTLYGMTHEDSLRVIQTIKQYRHLIVEICLHLPDANNNMTGYKCSDEYLKVLGSFIDLRKMKIIDNFGVMTMDRSGKYHPSLKNILNIKSPNFFGISRAGSLSDDAINNLNLRVPRNDFSLYCAVTPYYDHNILLPNGDVVLCCNDYKLRHILGNLNDLGYYELFKSETLTNLRIENQKPEYSKCSICKSCDFGVSYGKTEIIERGDNIHLVLVKRKFPARSQQASGQGTVFGQLSQILKASKKLMHQKLL